MGTLPKQPDYYHLEPPVITGNTKSYFYPRETGDTVENTFNATKCNDGGSILVSMWSISRSSPTSELRRLAAEGCQVKIVAHHIYNRACENLTAPGDGQVELHGFSAGRRYTHQKNILMDATYTGERHEVVFTGSANLNNPSLRENDENVIRVMDNKKVYDKFVLNFRNLIEATDIYATSENDCKVKFNGAAPPA